MDSRNASPSRQELIRGFIDGEYSLSSEDYERVVPLLWKLQEEWMYLWHRTKERGLVSELLTLAHRFQGLGREKQVDILRIYGDELESQTMKFDLEGFEEILGLYPKLVQTLGRCKK